MWDWIKENSSALSILLSLGTMIVWIAYFQILYLSYSRQRRTKMLINRGAGTGLESRCLISNMGAEPLYVVTIIAALREGDDLITAEVTDLDSSEVSDIRHAREGTHQGPMMSGEYMDAGRFSALMARCARANGRSTDDLETRFDSLELIVIGAYGAEDLSVGARRSFKLGGEAGSRSLVPTTVSTRQMRSRRDRRRLERHLQERLRPEGTDARV